MQQASLRQLRREFVNPLAMMLPLSLDQLQVYRHGELPPGLEGYQPRWEVVNAVLGARQTVQVKVDLMRGWNLLAVLGSATTNTVGGYRAQIYDVLRRQRLQDRGVQQPNLGGSMGGGALPGGFFLREPYPFDLPAAQMNVILQNLEAVANTIQLAFYGVAAPFTGVLQHR